MVFGDVPDWLSPICQVHLRVREYRAILVTAWFEPEIPVFLVFGRRQALTYLTNCGVLYAKIVNLCHDSARLAAVFLCSVRSTLPG